MKVRLPEFCVKKTPQSFCSPFFLTEYIQIDKLIIKKKKTIVKDTIKISPADLLPIPFLRGIMNKKVIRFHLRRYHL